MTEMNKVYVFRLRTIIDSLNHTQPDTIDADDTYIIATFNMAPTSELVETLKKHFFYTDRIDVKNAESQIYVEENTLYINRKHATVFQEVYNALCLLNHQPVSCFFTYNSVNISFPRKLPVLSFPQLMLIQDFIRPGQLLTEDLFVIGMYDEYTVMVKSQNLEAA